MQAYINTFSQRENGDKDSFLTIKTEAKINYLWWQKKGLQYTASGYGSKIPTQYMVKFNNRWHRVYCRIYSNIGTMFIQSGKLQFVVILAEDA